MTGLRQKTSPGAAAAARIAARDIRLLDRDVLVGRGVAVIANNELPQAVLFDGCVFLPDGHIHGALIYRKATVLRAGASFEGC